MPRPTKLARRTLPQQRAQRLLRHGTAAGFRLRRQLSIAAAPPSPSPAAATATASASADGRGTFSATWRSVDSNTLSHDNGQAAAITPDPIEYLKRFDASEATKPYREALLKAATVTLQEGASALDVGCGLGFNTDALCSAVGEHGSVLGVDISARAISAALARKAAAGSPAPVASTDPDPQFHIADVYSLSNKLPLDCGCFDVVLEDRVLQHLNRPLDAVKEMMAVAKPGARIVCGNPDWRSFQIDVTAAGAAGATAGCPPLPPPDKPSSCVIYVLRHWPCAMKLTTF